eukprot:403332903
MFSGCSNAYIQDKVLDTTDRRPDSPSQSIKVNQKLKVVLNENPSTGYQWQILNLNNINQRNVVSLVSDEYVAPTSQLIGAGGKRVFTFQGVKRGVQLVNMVYCHSWELDSILDSNGRLDPQKAKQLGVDYQYKAVVINVTQ